jgi:hypothetical protein
LSLRIIEIGRDSDDGILDFTAKVSLGDFLHLDQDHGGDLLGGELFDLSLESDLDDGLVGGTINDGKGPMLKITLDNSVAELASNKT